MARKRVIDTELYFDTEMVTLLGARGLHLYIRLWGLAEDWGGYAPNYKDIALRMGALNFKADEVGKLIQKLIEAEKVIEYEVNGKVYHWIKNFLRHQPLNNPSPPHIQLPSWIHCEIKEYKSGKKYANYSIIDQKLPVAYQYTTGKSVTVTETETKGNETAPPKGNNAEDFIQALKTNPAYQGIDIDRELSRMDAWLLTPKGKGRKKTHKFILNWLDRAERILPPSQALKREVVF